MPDRPGGRLHSRRPAWLAVAFCCAAAAQDASTSQPASQSVVVETIAAARQRLEHTKAQDRSRDDTVLLTALDFALSVASANGARVAALLDVTGYHVLPPNGELPERPHKPIRPEAVEKQVASRAKIEIGHVPTDRVALLSRAAAHTEFPAVAGWALPQDYVVVFRPAVRGSAPEWVARDACLVIRLRADKPFVLGGNLLEALVPATTVTPGR